MQEGRIPRLCRLDCGSSAGDASMNRFLLLPVGKLEIRVNFPVAENVVCPGSFAGVPQLPRLVAPNSQRPVYGDAKSLSYRRIARSLPPAFGKLRRAERNVNAVG